MKSTPALIKLGARHHQLILLAALGTPPIEIASKLHYTPTRVYALLQDPMIAPLIVEERARFRERVSSSLEQDLLADAPNTFQRLREIRDHHDPEIAIKGCLPLWDRQVPRKTEHKETHLTKIVLERRDVQYLKQVEGEVLAIDAELLDGPTT